MRCPPQFMSNHFHSHFHLSRFRLKLPSTSEVILSSNSTATAAVWAKKRQAAKPINKATIATIRKQFGVTGQIKPLRWAKFYAVSDDGRIFSTRATFKEPAGLREVTPSIERGSGYLFVDIYVDGQKRKNCRVHRLVALAFVKNTTGKKLVLHGDGNPSNNHVSNLRWDDAKANAADARRHRAQRLAAAKNHVDSDSRATAADNKIEVVTSPADNQPPLRQMTLLEELVALVRDALDAPQQVATSRSESAAAVIPPKRRKRVASRD